MPHSVASQTAQADRKQFAEFVDFIIRFMAQQGVVLGMPSELAE